MNYDILTKLLMTTVCPLVSDPIVPPSPPPPSTLCDQIRFLH